ncbi:hypothetical protein MG293_017386 [Ovis ammon polii]|uniref:Uncharacterized protein n=1 Tax=Ovis ammon polii TaxID=230172 RepID=A0AAD4Y3J2_OVIAM|nr:hypothetical protein MG293_017386 [Ovis ammon polii]
MVHNKRSHCNEKPTRCNGRAATSDHHPCSSQLQKAHRQQQRPSTVKNKQKILLRGENQHHGDRLEKSEELFPCLESEGPGLCDPEAAAFKPRGLAFSALIDIAQGLNIAVFAMSRTPLKIRGAPQDLSSSGCRF